MSKKAIYRVSNEVFSRNKPIFTFMNSFKKPALIAILLSCFAFGYSQKQAYISLDSLVSTMPETKVAQKVLTDFRTVLEQEVIAMQAEFDAKYKDYLEKKDSYSEAVRVNKETELQQLNKRIEDFKVKANEDIQRKYAELSGPIVAKAKKGIATVAKELGYKSVLDSTPGNVLYMDPSDNIFTQVKKKLDSMPAAEIPGAPKDTKGPEKNPEPSKGKKQ
ncbi:MAG: OmpH family outer membrane protein [Bacteroidetes bacterium]|jgi:outer membrane protein|nr:OmpH family outer membrane protein [Bacteroidota bacterium]